MKGACVRSTAWKMSFTSANPMDTTDLLVLAMLSQNPLTAYREMATSLKVSVMIMVALLIVAFQAMTRSRDER